MTGRTTQRTVTFARPFILAGIDQLLPAGTYSVETDEELLEGISFVAYRRTSAAIHLQSDPNHPGRSSVLIIDPNELDAALRRDQMSEEL